MKEIKEKKPILNIHYGWLMVIMCGLLIVVSFLFGGSIISIYTTIIADDLKISCTAFSLYTTIKYVVCSLISMVFVQIIKKVKLKKIIVFGVIISGAALYLLSFSNHMGLICAAGLLSGVGYTFTNNVPAAIIIANWFKKSRGVAMGIVTAFSGIGGIVFNPVFSHVVADNGWRFGFRIMSYICLAIGVLVLVFLKVTPEEMGMRPYGSEDKETQKAVIQPTLENEQPESNVYKNKNCIIMVLLMLCSTIGPIVVYSGITPILQEIGFDLLFATGTAASVASMTNLIGKMLMGFSDDKIGTKKTLIIWYILCLIVSLYFLIYRGTNPIIALLGVAIMGLIGAVYSVPMPLIAIQLFKNKKDYAKVVSLTGAATSLGNGVCLLIFFGVHDVAGSYTASLIYVSVLAVVCLVMVMALILWNKGKLR